MRINLVGKRRNWSWGCEPMIQRGFEALGHQVRFADLSDAGLDTLGPAALTVILQGYGLAPHALDRLRQVGSGSIVLWHAEVLGDRWPTDDPVVQAKAAQLEKVAPCVDVVVHHCATALATVQALGARRVAWCPISAVDAAVHRRLRVPKSWDIGIYGWASDRRLAWVRDTLACLPAGVEVCWPNAGHDGVYGETLIEFISRSRVILNCRFSDTRNTETRCWEALGCGTPLVSEPVSMPDLFPEGCGVRYARDPEGLAAAIQTILRLDEHSYRAVADAGYQWVHDRYGYRRQCARVLEAIAAALG